MYVNVGTSGYPLLAKLHPALSQVVAQALANQLSATNIEDKVAFIAFCRGWYSVTNGDLKVWEALLSRVLPMWLLMHSVGEDDLRGSLTKLAP